MRIFLTGATGYVGAAILATLQRAGHVVVALVRSPAQAAALAARGVDAIVGDLAAPDGYLAAAAACDAVVHAAFQYTASGEEDRAREQQATRALAGAARHFVYTANAYLLDTAGRAPVDEAVDPRLVSASHGAWRFDLEREVLAAPAAVIRLGMVYGNDRGTVADLFAAGGRVDTGPGRASVVYLHDLADLYRVVIERRATGIFHAVDGEPLAARELVRIVAALVGDAGAAAHPHTLDVLHRDVAVRAPRAFALGWRPRFASFRDGAPTAFAEWQRAR
ncbi:MAG TPA: NAD(P)H-binding protein [Kofleriaceae bacterium]|nr:NAD(P)H-binding protein [Kofleriaceae bacterium]